MKFSDIELRTATEALKMAEPGLREAEQVAQALLFHLAALGHVIVPAMPCPDCMGEGCTECNETGMVTL